MHATPPDHFPLPWASGWGEDKFGYWMTYIYQGVHQTFRWIAPGRFLMGSPNSERERIADEIQHQVTLTRGYWLAATACTQALWQVVMEENYSCFQDDARPVEMVTWSSVREFIHRLNWQHPGLKLRLPTEAEWEYACRAGTATPFSCGEDITLEQANFIDDSPQQENDEAPKRFETVPVCSFPPNSWGLYEMHGNVMEWCADFYAPYPEGPVEDPTGWDRNGRRVVRGGCWCTGKRTLRSAYRYQFGPFRGHDFVGFRLARGPELR